MIVERERLASCIAAVVNRHGARGLTLELVAEEAQLPRDEIETRLADADGARLMLHEEAVSRWRASLERSASFASDPASVESRLRAFVLACMEQPRALDLELVVDAAQYQPDAMRLWHELEEQWLESEPSSDDDPQRWARWRIRTAACGSWLREAITAAPLSAGRRAQVAARLTRDLAAASIEAEGSA